MEEMDIQALHSVIYQLKLLITNLEKKVAKGFNMKLDSKEKRRHHEWPLHQAHKLRWAFWEQDGVDQLVDQIHKLTQSLPHLYQRIHMYVSKNHFQSVGNH
jgi:hypothetical protein